MGTRSNIIVERTDGKWACIYCHWDGYLEHNGQILHDHYNSQERAEAVVAPGDMSSLAEHCDKPVGHSFDTKVPGYCVYYGSDRGETDVDARTEDNLAAVWPGSDTGAEYIYVWFAGCVGDDQANTRASNRQGWYVGDADEGSETLVPLADALAGKSVPTPNVKAFGGNFVIGTRK